MQNIQAIRTVFPFFLLGSAFFCGSEGFHMKGNGDDSGSLESGCDNSIKINELSFTETDAQKTRAYVTCLQGVVGKLSAGKLCKKEKDTMGCVNALTAILEKFTDKKENPFGVPFLGIPMNVLDLEKGEQKVPIIVILEPKMARAMAILRDETRKSCPIEEFDFLNLLLEDSRDLQENADTFQNAIMSFNTVSTDASAAAGGRGKKWLLQKKKQAQNLISENFGSVSTSSVLQYVKLASLVNAINFTFSYYTIRHPKLMRMFNGLLCKNRKLCNFATKSIIELIDGVELGDEPYHVDEKERKFCDEEKAYLGGRYDRIAKALALHLDNYVRTTFQRIFATAP